MHAMHFGINMEIIGWIGSILFAISGFPQALQCMKEGHSRGLAWGFLLAWLGGEIFTITYIWPKMDIPLLANYLVNLIFLGIMLRYKIWERDDNKIKEELIILYSNRHL